jgi:hypothetical protein
VPSSSVGVSFDTPAYTFGIQNELHVNHITKIYDSSSLGNFSRSYATTGHNAVAFDIFSLGSYFVANGARDGKRHSDLPEDYDAATSRAVPCPYHSSRIPRSDT